MKVDYPDEWNELPKRERQKKIKALKRQEEEKTETSKKTKKILVLTAIIALAVGGVYFSSKKSPEEEVFEQEVKEVSLEEKVEEFEIEGTEHVPPGTKVDYNTNPPTSGGHYALASQWDVYKKEIADEAAVHSLEHGGIWISYKDISEEEITILEEFGKQNSQSVLVSPRSTNDSKIVITSWGRYMKLEGADKALIQKYIETYKNDSPEKIAR